MNIIDTRDLAAELDELENRQSDADDALNPDEVVRLSELRDLADQIGDEWRYGAIMVPEAEFEDYARELAEEMGAIHADTVWPLSCIDWEQAARELAHDYSSVEWDGIDYMVQL